VVISEVGEGTFEDARAHCLRLGGVLASVIDQDQNEAIRKLLKASKYETLWIGASDLQIEGLWKWVELPEVQAFMIYNNWAYGNPDNGAGGENCAEMWVSGEWNDANCNARKAFACDNVPVPPPDMIFPCSLGVRQAAESAGLTMPESCRYLLPRTPNMYIPSSAPMDYESCVASCKARHPACRLVEPRSLAQDQLLASTMRSIGLTGLWLALRKRSVWKGGGWRWSASGDLLSDVHARWAIGRPEGRGAECAELLPDGSWNDVACAAERACACELPAVSDIGG
jgi:hypothetical protein